MKRKHEPDNPHDFNLSASEMVCVWIVSMKICRTRAIKMTCIHIYIQIQIQTYSANYVHFQHQAKKSRKRPGRSIFSETEESR